MTQGDPEVRQEAQEIDEREGTKSRTPKRRRLIIILLTVGKKLLMNPNFHATVAGIAWASISFG